MTYLASSELRPAPSQRGLEESLWISSTEVDKLVQLIGTSSHVACAVLQGRPWSQIQRAALCPRGRKGAGGHPGMLLEHQECENGRDGAQAAG